MPKNKACFKNMYESNDAAIFTSPFPFFGVGKICVVHDGRTANKVQAGRLNSLLLALEFDRVAQDFAVL